MKTLEKDFTYEDALSVCYPLGEPVEWNKYNLTVLFDGYLPDGTRVHIIEENKYPDAVLLGNAIVISRRSK